MKNYEIFEKKIKSLYADEKFDIIKVESYSFREHSCCGVNIWYDDLRSTIFLGFYAVDFIKGCHIAILHNSGLFSIDIDCLIKCKKSVPFNDCYDKYFDAILDLKSDNNYYCFGIVYKCHEKYLYNKNSIVYEINGNYHDQYFLNIEIKKRCVWH